MISFYFVDVPWKSDRLIFHQIFTLYDPRFLTEQASLTLRPAGTVTFSMTLVNSGSSTTTAHVGEMVKTIRDVLAYYHCILLFIWINGKCMRTSRGVGGGVSFAPR